MPESYLTPILETARTRAATLDRRALEAQAATVAGGPSFQDALAAPGLSVIAEVKRRSPSRGPISLDLDPISRAGAYVDGGARAISVLTEPHHFNGSNDDLLAVRRSVAIPVLRKDFTVDVRQIWEARALGASAVLLIVAALEVGELAAFITEADQLGIDALVEVHTPEEARVAVDAGARVIGVNNRNLSTFEVDLSTAERIAPLIETAEVTIAESGIWTAADAGRMKQAGFDAVLVGEALVRSHDPAGLVAEFMA